VWAAHVSHGRGPVWCAAQNNHSNPPLVCKQQLLLLSIYTASIRLLGNLRFDSGCRVPAVRSQRVILVLLALLASLFFSTLFFVQPVTPACTSSEEPACSAKAYICPSCHELHGVADCGELPAPAEFCASYRSAAVVPAAEAEAVCERRPLALCRIAGGEDYADPVGGACAIGTLVRHRARSARLLRVLAPFRRGFKRRQAVTEQYCLNVGGGRRELHTSWEWRRRLIRVPRIRAHARADSEEGAPAATICSNFVSRKSVSSVAVAALHTEPLSMAQLSLSAFPCQQRQPSGQLPGFG
jgi:hypothetical protein